MRVAVFGDSVFAGYGLAPHQAPAAQLQMLRPEWSVIAAGVPDETSADGLARVDRIVGDVVFVEFGLNDAIDGVPGATTAAHLRTIAERLRAAGSAVVIVEALVPASSRWPALVDQTGLAARVANDLSTKLLSDIMTLANDERQADGLHPSARGAARIAEEIATMLGQFR